MKLADLRTALGKCRGGETIDLNGAAIGAALLQNFQFDTPVTIANGSMNFSVRKCRNIIFDSMDLGESLAGYGSAAIAVRRSRVSDMVSKPGVALQFHNIADGFVEETEFAHCRVALALRGCSSFLAARNRFRDLLKDGVRIAEGADGVRIEDSLFWDFYPGEVGGEATHPDAIQAATDKEKPTFELLIRRNRIWRGKGQAVQGVFCRTYPGRINYEGLAIEDNVAVGTLYNGFHFTGSGSFRRNTLIALPDQRTWIRPGDWRGAFEGNIAPDYNDGKKLIAPPPGNLLAA